MPAYLQTPQVPPSFLQCLQYLQFLQALHALAPLQVATREEGVRFVLVTSFAGAALREMKETKSIKSDFIMIFFL